MYPVSKINWKFNDVRLLLPYLILLVIIINELGSLFAAVASSNIPSQAKGGMVNT